MPDNDPRTDTALRRLVDRVPDVVFRLRLSPERRIEYISRDPRRPTRVITVRGGGYRFAIEG